MKAIYSPHRITWSKFASLPHEADTHLDISALQKRLDAGRSTPLRWLRGSFRCPKDATPGQRYQLMNDAVKSFISIMAKQGWELRGTVQVLDSPYPATAGPEYKVTLPDQQEYIIKGVFEKKDFHPLRIEIPPHLVKPNG